MPNRNCETWLTQTAMIFQTTLPSCITSRHMQMLWVLEYLIPTSKLSFSTPYHIHGTLQLQHFTETNHQLKWYLNCKFGGFGLVMITSLIWYRVLWPFMHLPPDAKTKTNLSVINPTAMIVTIPLMSVIGLVVAKRDNFHLVLEREGEQKKVPPTLNKMDSEKHHPQT